MSPPVVVLRPEPGCAETCAAALAMGLDAIAAPLFAIEPVAWEAPDPDNFDGLLVGSANAFRHGGDGLARLTPSPVFAVGNQTAAAARAAGFGVAHTGEGGLQALLDGLAAPRRLLRLAGETRVTLAPPPGVGISERVVYRAAPQPLSKKAAAQLSLGAVALLHSGEAARALSAECDRLAIDRAAVAIAALAPRVAEAAGGGWRAVRVAPVVSDAALLAMAADMCQ